MEHPAIRMSRNPETGISLATPPAIHVGPILNPGTNETISIVIPLSAQLATVPGPKIEKPCKDCVKDAAAKQQQHQHPHPHPPPPMPLPPPPPPLPTTGPIRRDKTKGCPFPTCVRYGRAFSRAHDLKRHIARHELRKEKLSDLEKHHIGELPEHIRNDPVFQRERQYHHHHHHAIGREDLRDMNVKCFSCPTCRKRYTSESKFRAHISAHDKVFIENGCALCNIRFQNKLEFQEHMKQHTAHFLHATMEKGGESSREKDEDFLLEEMLLLNKNTKRSKDNASKIRCDYCSKTFKTKWTLSSHVAAHEGRFQFDCNQCGKKFVRKSHYEGHVRSHEAARPYICEQCGKTFKELKHRREHTKRKHPSNQNAIQNLLDSIGPCASEEMPADQTKFTLLMPVNFPG